MTLPRRLPFAATVLAALGALAVAGQDAPEMKLPGGGSATGDIVFDGEEDRIALPLIAGMQLTVTAKPTKGSALSLSGDVLDSGEIAVSLDPKQRKEAKGALTLKKVAIPTSGTWFVALRGTADGALGEYDLKTQVTAPPAPPKVSDTLTAGTTTDLTVEALPGTLITVKVSRGKGSGIVPRIDLVLDPDGMALDLSGVKRKETATSVQLTSIPASLSGVYTIRLSGAANSGGTYVATLKRKFAAVSKTKVDLHGATGGLADRDTLLSIDTLPTGAVSVAAGGSAQRVARGTYAGGRTRDLTRAVQWATRNRAVATMSDTTDGLIQGVATGGTTVQAWLGGVEARETLALVGGATISAVAVAPAVPRVAAGEAIDLQATATFATPGGVTEPEDVSRAADWTKSGPALSSVAGGRAVGATAGTSQVFATVGGVASAAHDVDVTAPRVISISVSPTYAEVTSGNTQRTFFATATYSDGSTSDVSSTAAFTCDNLAAATFSGRTATRVANGTAAIRATLAGVTSRPSTLNSGPVALSSIVVTGTATVPKGAVVDLTATGAFADGGQRDITESVTWSSNAAAVATVSTTDGGRGKVTGVGTTGTATITASLTIASISRSGSRIVTAAVPAVKTLRIVPTITTLTSASPTELTAVATLTDGSTADVSAMAAWTTSSTPVATVIGGRVTQAGAGGAVIAAVSGAARGAAVVTSNVTRASGLTLSFPSAQAAVGESAVASAIVTFSPISTGDVSHELGAAAAGFSSDPIAVAFADGSATSRAVASSELRTGFGGLVSNALTFGATVPAPRTLTVFPQAVGVPITNDFQLTAQLRNSDQSTTDVTATSTWQSLQTGTVTVNSTGLVHPVAKGTATVRAQNSALTGDGIVQVLGDPPVVSTVSPTTVLRGSVGTTLTITGTDLDTLSPMVSISGTGVTITSGPTPGVGGTSSTVTIDVSAGAATGLRDLTYSNIVGQSTLLNAFQILAPSPTLVSVSPTNIDVPVSGSTNTTLTATGTNFTAGDTISVGSPTGVSLSNITVVNATTITATVTVQSTAPRARLNVTVIQSMANGGATSTKTGALKIGPVDPLITSMEPSFFLPGQGTAAGRIRGTGFQSGIAVGFPGAVTANLTTSNVVRVSSTEITYQITVPVNAVIGLQDVSLTNTGDIANTVTGAFAVVPRDPTIASFSAKAIARGATNVDVVVKGTNFRSGVVLTASGSDVSFSNVSLVDPETITAKCSATSNASLTARDVTVSHASSEGGRGATLLAALQVVSGAPTVTSLNPTKIGRTGSGGVTRRVPIVITGTNFSHGATVSLTKTSGSGLTVVSANTATLSQTSLAFEVDVAGTASTGFWDVKVTNPSAVGDSGSSGAALLEIAAENALAVNRVIASSGGAAGGERVTVQGSGFTTGCRVEFGAEKAPAVQFIDQNTLVCNVPPPGNPSGATSTTLSRTAATVVDVKVTNSPSGSSTSATLTKGYSYAADGRVFQIVAGFPALNQTTNVKQNLKSAILKMSAPTNTATAVIGGTGGTHCFWFESGNFTVSGQTVGFGADRRFLVFSRTSGGNLPINGTGKYILEIPVAVKSDAGTPLQPTFVSDATKDQWNFTLSGSTTDSTAPTISSSIPASSATGVAPNTAVSVTFSEEIDPLTFTTSSVQLKQSSTVISCAYAFGDDFRTVTLTPTETLATNTQYTISVSSTVADLYGNAITATTRTFTTWTSDTTAPTIDAVVLADLPASMDGSTTYVPGPDDANATGPSAVSFDSYLPTYGWTVVVKFSDLGLGADPTTFSAKASVAVGSSSANAELASKFTITGTTASFTVGSADAFAAGDNVTFTFSISDKAVPANASASKVIQMDIVGIDTAATGGTFTSGGDHDPFDTRETWVLRFDRDVYSGTFSTSSSTQQLTTTAASNGVPDYEEALRLNGMQSTNMTTAAAAAVNGPSTGTNAIVARLFQERLRASLRVRYGIGEDGSMGANAANIEFLLPGEKGSLSALPTWSSTANSTSSNAYSEMDVGGDTAPNSSQTGTFGTLGRATLDLRNRGREANINVAATGSNVGVFTINLFKNTANLGTGFLWNTRVLLKFQAAKTGTPMGEHADDATVLAGSFDRTAVSNTQSQNDRYDAIMDVIEAAAMAVSGVAAHEVGHSVGLVPDGGPKTGLFGNVHHTNTFTEATASSTNTGNHLNYLGNDIMSPASSVDDRTQTGTDIQKFSPTDRNYLLHRQVHDEGK